MPAPRARPPPRAWKAAPTPPPARRVAAPPPTKPPPPLRPAARLRNNFQLLIYACTIWKEEGEKGRHAVAVLFFYPWRYLSDARQRPQSQPRPYPSGR
ncbi:hypothetical protein FDY95_19140 [Hymenobacter jeollabukensis]|uniref:Uncharacterized protein n=1 Tax=Hymenobacter jeollabukensis TaxID=2025313 RepID=A0A5R8WME4_9BACT|nr:hypothetical protein FDY95_19140 [Hymenobacter jeollabukensis]